jgi:hypothetical protein
MSIVTGVAFSGAINSAAQKYGLDPTLLAAVAAQETGGPGAVSGRNIVGDGGHGRGVFQIDDRWHAFAATPAAMDPAKNADYAAGLLKQNLDATHGDVQGALSMYNSGTATGALGYAASVLQHQAQIAGGGFTTVAGSAGAAASAAAGGLATQLRADAGTNATGVNALQSLLNLFTGGGSASGAADAQATVQIAMPSQSASTNAFTGAKSDQILAPDAPADTSNPA